MIEYLQVEETRSILAGVARQWIGGPPSAGWALLARGVAADTREWANAARGIVAPTSSYVLEDYEDLPPASYWSCEGGLFPLDVPLKHALGGDHPGPFERARRGALLFRSFELGELDPRLGSLPPGLASSDLAYEVLPDRRLGQVASRLERLVFSEVRAHVASLPEVLALLDPEPDAVEERLQRLYLAYLDDLVGFEVHRSGDPVELREAFLADHPHLVGR